MGEPTKKDVLDALLEMAIAANAVRSRTYGTVARSIIYTRVVLTKQDVWHYADEQSNLDRNGVEVAMDMWAIYRMMREDLV